MILKVYSEGKKLFFDRIQHVAVSMVHCATREGVEELIHKADYNNIALPPVTKGESINRSFLWIGAQRETIPPTPLVLAMEGDVYLLNDINGKTIERL